MRKLLCLLITLILLASALPLQAFAMEVRTLVDGIEPIEALALAASCAEHNGQKMDTATLAKDGGTASVNAGIFTLSVESVNGQATSVTIACAYLDSDYATILGKTFGMILSTLGSFEDTSVILTSLDYSAIETLSANNQTLVYGDYKVSLKVDPDSKTPYQMSLSLLNPPKAAVVESDANGILTAMNADVSAVFVYDEASDPNGKLGKSGEYSSKVNFALRSIDPNAVSEAGLDISQGGSIEVFAKPEEAIARQNYVANTQATYFGTIDHSFVCGSAYLRLSSNIAPDEAGRLISAFISKIQNTGTSTAAAEPAPAVEAEPASPEAPMLQVGDTIEFGAYEQDGNTANGKEAIEWKVLKVEDGKAMLVSTYALDVYNTYWGSPTWDNSTLRSWLNSDFMTAAFNPEEQQSLVVSTITADKNPNYSSDPGDDTRDAVFCLSYPEAQELLTAAERKTEPTAYAKKTAKVYTEGNGCCYWWLRTPGKPGCGASIVCTDGSFDYDLSYDGFSYGVRPAIWLEL